MARPRPAPAPPSGQVCPDCGHHYVLHRRTQAEMRFALLAGVKLERNDPTALGHCSAGAETLTSSGRCSCTRYRHTIEEPYLANLAEREERAAWR